MLTRPRRQAAAVVLNHQHQPFILLPALKRHRAGVGVLNDVVQSFLTDAKQRHPLAFAECRFVNSPVEMADDAAAFQLHFAHQ